MDGKSEICDKRTHHGDHRQEPIDAGVKHRAPVPFPPQHQLVALALAPLRVDVAPPLVPLRHKDVDVLRLDYAATLAFDPLGDLSRSAGRCKTNLEILLVVFMQQMRGTYLVGLIPHHKLDNCPRLQRSGPCSSDVAIIDCQVV